MAMIGRNAAVAEVGPKRRRELHGVLAFASWLGVHAWLLSGFRERVNALGVVGLGLHRQHPRLGDHRPARRRPHRLARVAACRRVSAPRNGASGVSPRSSSPPDRLSRCSHPRSV